MNINLVKTFEQLDNSKFQCVISTIGFGKSKKEAEEQAILNLNFNAIGKLIELCNKRKWDLPIYVEQPVTGTLHNKIFNFSCSITSIENKSTHTAFGSGSSKVQAKKDAAMKLLNMVVRTEM